MRGCNAIFRLISSDNNYSVRIQAELHDAVVAIFIRPQTLIYMYMSAFSVSDSVSKWLAGHCIIMDYTLINMTKKGHYADWF